MEFLGAQVETSDGYRQVEPARTGATGVDVEDAVLFVLGWLVGVAE